LKTILFDLDGTLIDSTEAIVLSFFDVYDKFGFKKPKPEAIKRLIGHTLEDMFLSLGIEDNRVIKESVLSYKEFYRQRALEMTTLLPGASEAIKTASKIADLGIVTTKTGRYSKDLLEHFGVMSSFKTLIGREHVTHPKPHPEPIQKALEKINKDSKNCWMIGDTKLDLICAKRAGVKSVAVLSGYGKKDELQKYTDTIFSSSLEAVKWLKNLPTLHVD